MKSYFYFDLKTRKNGDIKHERIDANYDGEHLDITKKKNGDVKHYKLEREDIKKLFNHQTNKESILERLQNDFKVKRKAHKKSKSTKSKTKRSKSTKSKKTNKKTKKSKSKKRN